MKKRSAMKLRLSKETLAYLDNREEMVRIVGGVSAVVDTDCSDCRNCPFSPSPGCGSRTTVP